ncbi:cAMP-binding domain of CRP or a regulatory subunit of cAMP-dependent protein kinases [Streptomyces sp. 1222.5]|uniref:Crp/Fnr family transcriptional regulator n=1 Tax=unclassified Streptomyces TaxID=2593676 RepID=UPI00089AC5C3|nr:MULTISPECIES: Crp/Fnr family transcriptional regulator [unclassified Streptomyces]PKW00383.1 CRP-like cAMP-binding protein [Streptomyces sp. 5112.2]SED86750.1 cAMP-binding domain of CRP or a regulatory subunit of cAMP-dependent protein kinases [Streptomyces sp. 1222.5]
MDAATSTGKFVADRGRRVRHPRARAVDKLFRSDEHVPGWSQVSKLAVSSMFEQSTLRHGPVDTRLFLTGSQIYNVVFVTSGSVREEYADGKVRLWGEGAVLGYWYESSDALPPSRGYSLTSGTAVISIAPDALRMLMLQHSDLALGVMHLITAHHRVTEDVYGVCKESPASRVARLLLYLSQASLAEGPVIRTRSREDGKSVVRPIPGGIVEGPTQADIADALGLARATVEKIIASFRAEGVLWKPSPGERRRNRVYEIQDRTLLEEIAGRRSWY